MRIQPSVPKNTICTCRVLQATYCRLKPAKIQENCLQVLRTRARISKHCLNLYYITTAKYLDKNAYWIPELTTEHISINY